MLTPPSTLRPPLCWVVIALLAGGCSRGCGTDPAPGQDPKPNVGVAKCPPGQRAQGARCVPFEELRTLPPLPSQRPSRALAALRELGRALGHGSALPGWFARQGQLALQGGRAVETPAWDLGVVQGVLTQVAIPGVQLPIDAEHLFVGDNLVGFGLRFRVADRADDQLYDRLRSELVKALGAPEILSPGVEKLHAPGLEVYIQRHPSPALTQALKKPVTVARLLYLCPKQDLDRAALKAVP